MDKQKSRNMTFVSNGVNIQALPKLETSYSDEWVRVILCEGTKSVQLVRDGKKFTIELGIGETKDITRRSLQILARRIVEEAEKVDCTHILLPHAEAFLFDGALKLDLKELGELLAINFTLAHYTFRLYKTAPKSGWKQIKNIVFAETTSKHFKDGLVSGSVIGVCMNETRDLANTPGGDMTPSILAKSIQLLLKISKVSVKVFAKKDIEKLGMGALLGVARGSTEDPRFIVMEYKGGKNTESPIVFVGKGITFDTGGLNLKPSDGILEMHLDMSGGAVVAGALKAIAELGIKRNVIGLIPSAENMISGESYRPGDILTTMNGKTVEVLNTDAEGRLVLADALTYAERYKPLLVVDVATLTGAALVALGTHASALMTKNVQVQTELLELAEQAGDYLWPLPLWDEYIQYTKGIHADLANIQSNGNTRYGGAINGGAFLSHFSGKYPWAHIDSAPRMVAGPGDHLKKGATGEPLRLLVKIAQSYRK